MWQYRTDTTKNRLYVTVQEDLDAAHAKFALRGIVQAMNLLKPGFAVVAELLQPLQGTDPVPSAIRALEDVGQQYGAARIVYVPGWGQDQGGYGARPVHVLEAAQAASVADAERLLEEPRLERVSEPRPERASSRAR